MKIQLNCALNALPKGYKAVKKCNKQHNNLLTRKIEESGKKPWGLDYAAIPIEISVNTYVTHTLHFASRTRVRYLMLRRCCDS